MANRPSRLLTLILAPVLGFGLLLGWLSAEFASSRIEQAELELAEKLLARVETNIQPFLDPVDPISLQVVLDEYARSLPDAAISLIDIDGIVIVSAGDVPDHHQALSVGLINKGEMAGQLVSQLRIERADAVRNAVWSGTLITLIVMTALLTGLVFFFGDFVMLWLGFPAGPARGTRPQPPALSPNPELPMAEAEAPEACLSASLHFFPGRLITKQDVTAAITHSDLEVTQIREGVFELHLAPCRRDHDFSDVIGMLASLCAKHGDITLRGALLTGHSTEQNDLKKKARFYALSAKDELIIDSQVQDALVSMGWADEEIIQPFHSTLISDDQLYSFRFD